MATDFADAHSRHWQDAELLFEHHRWANADQLYGLSAECGLKAVMEKLGMPVGDVGPEKKYREHVKKLWPVFHDFANGRGGARYLEMLPRGDPFANWAIDARYGKSDDFRPTDVAPHRAATERIAHMVAIAGQD